MRRAIFLAAIAGASILGAVHAETGTFTIHMILHAIGEERYEVAQDSGGLALKTSSEYSDRGMKRTAEASLRMTADYTPVAYDSAMPARKVAIASTAAIDEAGATRTADLPARYFTVFGPSPFAIQMAMMRYWLAHGKPARLPVLRAKTGFRGGNYACWARFHFHRRQTGSA